jgi:hypothetical protein
MCSESKRKRFDLLLCSIKKDSLAIEIRRFSEVFNMLLGLISIWDPITLS